MDFEFYNYLSQPTGLRRMMLPMQRLARRVLRPMFNRLRDLLTLLFHRQEEDRRTIADLQNRVTALEATVTQLTANRRAFQLDYVALTRRVAQLEDLLLQSAAVKGDPLDGLLPIDADHADHANNGAVRKAS
jgi:hypothetical protein